MSIIKKINITKISLVISFAAFFLALGTTSTPCVQAASGVCDTGDTLVTNTLEIQSGTAYKYTVDASGMTADRTVELIDETSETVPDSSGATTGDILTKTALGTAWQTAAGGSNFGSTAVKMKGGSSSGVGLVSWGTEVYDLCSPGCISTGSGGYTALDDGYYEITFAGDWQVTASLASAEMHLMVNGSAVDVCYLEPYTGAGQFIWVTCTSTVYATAGQVIGGGLYTLSGLYSQWGQIDDWMTIARVD